MKSSDKAAVLAALEAGFARQMESLVSTKQDAAETLAQAALVEATGSGTRAALTSAQLLYQNSAGMIIGTKMLHCELRQRLEAMIVDEPEGPSLADIVKSADGAPVIILVGSDGQEGGA